MGVNQRRQLHPLHLFEQQRNVVDSLRDDVRYLIHAQSLAQSGIYLQIWANGKKMATDAYRGAGRPEATYAIERLMDTMARELQLDPAEVRRRNFIRDFSRPT